MKSIPLTSEDADILLGPTYPKRGELTVMYGRANDRDASYMSYAANIHAGSPIERVTLDTLIYDRTV